MTEAIEDLQQPVEDTVRLRDGEIELLPGTPSLQRKEEIGQCSRGRSHALIKTTAAIRVSARNQSR